MKNVDVLSKLLKPIVDASGETDYCISLGNAGAQPIVLALTEWDACTVHVGVTIGIGGESVRLESHGDVNVFQIIRMARNVLTKVLVAYKKAGHQLPLLVCSIEDEDGLGALRERLYPRYFHMEPLDALEGGEGLYSMYPKL